RLSRTKTCRGRCRGLKRSKKGSGFRPDLGEQAHGAAAGPGSADVKADAIVLPNGRAECLRDRTTRRRVTRVEEKQLGTVHSADAGGGGVQQLDSAIGRNIPAGERQRSRGQHLADARSQLRGFKTPVLKSRRAQSKTALQREKREREQRRL